MGSTSRALASWLVPGASAGLQSLSQSTTAPTKQWGLGVVSAQENSNLEMSQWMRTKFIQGGGRSCNTPVKLLPGSNFWSAKGGISRCVCWCQLISPRSGNHADMTPDEEHITHWSISKLHD